jgi:hypothetical protein
MSVSAIEWFVVLAIAGLPAMGAAMALVSSVAWPRVEWPAIFVLGASALVYAVTAMFWWALNSSLSIYLGTWCVAWFLAFAAFNRWFRPGIDTGRGKRRFEL